MNKFRMLNNLRFIDTFTNGMLPWLVYLKLCKTGKLVASFELFASNR